MDKFESKVIVSGIGLSAIGRSIDRSGTDLVLDAALDAIADAGLQPNDIDGLASMPFGDRPPEEIADAVSYTHLDVYKRQHVGWVAMHDVARHPQPTLFGELDDADGCLLYTSRCV